MKIRLRDIGLTDLDSQSVILISDFVRIARAQEGADIRLKDNDIIHAIFKLGASTKNSRLRMMFLSLRRGMQQHFGGKRPDTIAHC